MPRQRIHVQLDGLVAVHAVRAVWTALGAVPGLLSAEVTMQGAVLELDGDLDRAALDAALDAAGVSVRSIRVEARILPVL
jgi:copper chaperone CopZ